LSYGNEQAALARKSCWLVKLIVDYCQLTFGESCPAWSIVQDQEAASLYEFWNESGSNWMDVHQTFTLEKSSTIKKVKVKVNSTGLTSAWNTTLRCTIGTNYADKAVFFPSGSNTQVVEFDFSLSCNAGLWDFKINFAPYAARPSGSHFYPRSILVDPNGPYDGGHMWYQSWQGMIGAEHHAQNVDLWFEASGWLGEPITGPACYYTYETCKDRASYGPVTKTYMFSSRDSKVRGAAAASLPYVESVTYIPIEIDPKNNVTRRGDLTVKMGDDRHLPGKSNPDKTASNIETRGTFWRNWLARNPNYYHRIIEVYQGFEGLGEDDFHLYFRGIIENIKYQNFGVEIQAKDLLKKLDAESHNKQDDRGTLAANYTGGATCLVHYGNQLPDWGVIKTEDNKYIKYSGVSGPDSSSHWTLSNAAYCFGSSGTAASGKKVRQVLRYERDDGAGFSVDWILLDLLCERAGIPASYIATVDSGATLSAGINASATSIPVSDISKLPDQGVVKIGNEFIIYKGKSGSNLDLTTGSATSIFHQHLRGAFKTSAASHSSGDKVCLPKITAEAWRWINGLKYKCPEIINPKKVQDILNRITEQSLVQVWENEDGLVDFKCISPPYLDENVRLLDETGNIVEDSLTVDDNTEQRYTRAEIYYGPTQADAGDDPKNYSYAYLLVDEDLENIFSFGEVKAKVFCADWIYEEVEASLLASRWMTRYSKGATLYKFRVEIKEMDLATGQFVRIASRKKVNPDGSPLAAQVCQILKKQIRGVGQIELTAINAHYDELFGYVVPARPKLNDAVNNTATSIKLKKSADDGLGYDDLNPASGQLRIENEFVNFTGVTLNADGTFTLTDCTRGCFGSTAASHGANTEVLVLYTAASENLRKYGCWIGDEKNLIDTNGDGVGDKEGFCLY